MKAVEDFLTRCLRAPYELGNNDCALFAGRVAYLATGRDDIRRLLDELIGTYDAYTDGLKALEAALQRRGLVIAAGMHPLEAAANHFFGDPVAPLQAMRYDVVCGNWGNGKSLGICEGHRIIGIAETGGLIRFPLTAGEKAWHVRRR